MSRFAPLALLLLLLVPAPSAQARNFDDALAWIPADVSTLVAIDLEGMRKTKFFKEMQRPLVDLIGFGRELKQLERAGFDVLGTVKTVVYAGPDEMVRKAGRSLVILEGSFDTAKIKDYYDQKGKRPLTEKTSPLGPYYEVGKIRVAVFGAYAVIGDPTLFDAALAAKQANEGGTKAKAYALVKRFKGAKHGFGVIAGSQQLKKILGKDFKEVEGVDSAAFSLDLSSGLGIEVVGHFANAGEATKVVDSVKATVGDMAADPEVAELGLNGALQKVQANAKGTEVTIDVALDPSESATLTETLKELF